jgi:hypothetical protein
MRVFNQGQASRIPLLAAAVVVAFLQYAEAQTTVVLNVRMLRSSVR